MIGAHPAHVADSFRREMRVGSSHPAHVRRAEPSVRLVLSPARTKRLTFFDWNAQNTMQVYANVGWWRRFPTTGRRRLPFAASGLSVQPYRQNLLDDSDPCSQS